MRLFFSFSQTLFASLLCFIITSTHSRAQITTSDFVTTWKTNNGGVFASNQILIPSSGEYTVYYESIPAGIAGTLPETGTFTDGQTLTFPADVTYRIAIKPTGATPFHRIQFQSFTDNNKLLAIEQWGTAVWSSMKFAYQRRAALTTLPETDLPVLSNVTSMRSAFANCSSLIGSSRMNSWDVSNVTNMRSMFILTPFNQPIGAWNVGKVTIMDEMFGASAFNQPINSWDVSMPTEQKKR